MFGHLKAEDFVNLMEGIQPAAQHKAHLDACAQCHATWESVRSMHAEMSSQASSMDAELPEPDWAEFRSSVRDQLLSRSIQRQSSLQGLQGLLGLRWLQGWTGWAIRPAAAWALSVVLAVGITTVTLLWNVEHRTSAPVSEVAVEAPVLDPAAEVIEVGPERGLFDEVLQLGDEQQEQLRQLLESAQRGAPYRSPYHQ
jgi:hypothetical protein